LIEAARNSWIVCFDQEVAYNSLLIERRKLLHERAGQALEAIFAEQLDDHLTQLAHHYRYSDNVDKAVEYLGRAGNQALKRSVHAAAVINLTSAVDLLQKLPDSPARVRRELPLQLAMIPAFNQVKGWGSPEVLRASTRARELCEQLGNPPELFYVVYGAVCGVHFIRAELKAALEGSRQLLQRAKASQHPVPLLYAHFILGETLFHMGELPLARKHHQIALSLDDPRRPLSASGPDAKVVNLSYMSWILWWLGYPDQALKSCKEAIEAARALSHSDSMAFDISPLVWAAEPRPDGKHRAGLRRNRFSACVSDVTLSTDSESASASRPMPRCCPNRSLRTAPIPEGT